MGEFDQALHDRLARGARGTSASHLEQAQEAMQVMEGAAAIVGAYRRYRAFVAAGDLPSAALVGRELEALGEPREAAECPTTLHP